MSRLPLRIYYDLSNFGFGNKSKRKRVAPTSPTLSTFNCGDNIISVFVCKYSYIYQSVRSLIPLLLVYKHKANNK